MSRSRALDDVTIHRVGADAVRPLRVAVLRPTMSPLASAYPGDAAPATGHFAAVHGERVAGVATILHEDAPDDRELMEPMPRGTAWRLRGMAVEPAHRGQGVGARLLTRCVAHALDAGRQVAWCNAREVAVGFYRANGWRVVSDRFDLPPSGPHHVMRLDLPAHGHHVESGHGP